MNRQHLEKKIGKIDEKLEKLITDMGTPIEYVTETEVAVEVFPNRPDLLSLQNLAKAIMQYKGKSKIKSYKMNAPEKNYQVTIDKSVKGIRNHTQCCIIKGIKFDNQTIKEIIEIQEKLHNSLGRKRKKLAIGIYPLEKITLPITFKAENPAEIKFKPLEFAREITGKQILSQHPAGREYGDLLKNEEKYPIFIDAKNKILSMPPIINSDETGRITKDTKEIFIEVSGNNLHHIKKALAILVATLYEMGGKIYEMNIIDKKQGNSISPNMTPDKMPFTIENINKTLGVEFTQKEIKKNLEKMGIKIIKEKEKTIALIPAYRADILGPIDLTEEVAIAHGYDNFEPILPNIATIGEEDKTSKIKKTLNNILSGLGLLEVSSFHLTTKKNIKKIHFEMNDFIEVEDSKTRNNTLRPDLTTNLMQIFSENSNAQYPQKIYELGTVFQQDKEEETETGIKETENLAVALVDEKFTFTEIKQILDYLFKMLDTTYTLQEYDEHPAYIKGRCGKIIVKEKEIGYIGEIAPRVLRNWKIKVPAVTFELDIGFLTE